VQFVWTVLSKIAEYISPFPVIAFDLGTFGIGLILCDLAPTSSDPSQAGNEENLNNSDNIMTIAEKISSILSVQYPMADRGQIASIINSFMILQGNRQSTTDLSSKSSQRHGRDWRGGPDDSSLNESSSLDETVESDSSCMIFTVVKLKLI
jgi:hypothetical protein